MEDLKLFTLHCTLVKNALPFPNASYGIRCRQGGMPCRSSSLRLYSARSSFFFSGFSHKCAAVLFYKSINNDPSRHYSRFIREFQRVFEIV